MPTILVSNNSELLRHLSSLPFRRMNVEVLVASNGEQVMTMAAQHHPQLAILDAEMPTISGYQASRDIKQLLPNCKVVLVVGKRLTAVQMRRASESSCDEVLIAPMGADELYDVAAIQLGLPRRGAERFAIDLAVLTRDGTRSIDGRVTNLSVDGARLVLPEPIAEGAGLRLIITPDETRGEPIEIRAQVVWSQTRDGATLVGAAFQGLDEETRTRLACLTQWEIVEGAERTRVVLKGDITEATSFKDLLPLMVGRVDFDLSQVTYINSLGVREWVNFLRAAKIQGYEFHACSIPFVLQASLVGDVLGRGTMTSFFAPYHCEKCLYDEERLLQSATVLASDLNPPTFACPACQAALVLDDLPDRYFAFLRVDE